MEEIEEVVGDKTTVEADDLDKLTYMSRSCIEHLQHTISMTKLTNEVEHIFCNHVEAYELNGDSRKK